MSDALAIAAALEQSSSHPLARAVRNAAEGLTWPTVSAQRDIAGAGVEGVIEGRRYRLGHTLWSGSGEACARERLMLTDDQGVIARLSVREQPRADAQATVAALLADDADVAILSGDAASRVEAVAATLGIEHWRAEASPEDKLVWLRQLREQGHGVAMVGDGINDAPVLAAADVAVGLGSGSALAQATSGLLLAGDRLEQLPQARRSAREMLTVIRQNMHWAVGYNLAAVPLAAAGFVPPWLAAIGMSASSLLVLLNSLRIGRRAERPAPAPATPATHTAREVIA
jgi:Cu2+-exporting ATPase